MADDRTAYRATKSDAGLEAGRAAALDASIEREWLVTNGLGGYASGTIAGAATRRYHGLLIAARPRRSAG